LLGPGKYRWFLSRLEPLRASDGTLLYWIGINLDIEELKRAEEQRKTAEEKIREHLNLLKRLNREAGMNFNPTFAIF